MTELNREYYLYIVFSLAKQCYVILLSV